MQQIRMFLAITILLLTFSCTREAVDDPQQVMPEVLSVVPSNSPIFSDPQFKALIKGQLDHYKKVTNPDGIREIMVDNKITESEYVSLPGYFGYASASEFENYCLLLNNRGKYLNNKYGFKNLPGQDQFQILKTGFENELAIGPNLADASCETIRRTCLANVAAQATGFHFGCLSIDLSLFGGIVCHAAAFAYQITASSQCNNEYDDCMKKSPNLQ